MYLPMMGFLLALFFGGAIGGLFLFVVRPLRRLAPFALIPILAGITALIACSVLSVWLEDYFHSSDMGGLGFFGGYILGGLAGAALGTYLALRRMMKPSTSN